MGKEGNEGKESQEEGGQGKYDERKINGGEAMKNYEERKHEK